MFTDTLITILNTPRGVKVEIQRYLIYYYVCSVPSFEATKYPITNGEYLEFVVDGGYGRRDLWSDEGWQWVQQRQARHPTFWICSHGFTSPEFLRRFRCFDALY